MTNLEIFKEVLIELGETPEKIERTLKVMSAAVPGLAEFHKETVPPGEEEETRFMVRLAVYQMLTGTSRFSTMGIGKIAQECQDVFPDKNAPKN